MNATWGHILLNLQKNLPEGVVKVWLEPLRGEVAALAAQPGEGQAPLWELRLTAPNDFVAGWVRDRLSSSILEAARDVLGSAPALRLSAAPAPVREAPKPLTPEALAAALPSAPAVLAASAQLTLPISLPRPEPSPLLARGWKHSFEDFVIGPCNQLAHAAACNMLQASAPVDMLFLCSGSGLGKTHLAQAVGKALCHEADKRSASVAYLTAEEFTTQYVQASRFGGMSQFKERFRALDMLLLEDVHFLRGKDGTQEELLATIKALQSRGGKVVLTSSFAPRDLAGVDSQLVSRFCSGFVAAIDRPCRDTRFHILLEKARRQSVNLPEAVADMLADRVTSDIRMLESCLHNLALKSRLLGRPVTEEMALEVIRNVADQHAELGLEAILDLVCRGFELTRHQLVSRSRRQELVIARNTAFYLLRKHTSLTLEEIGQSFSRRHSTVLKGITSVEREISRQSPLGRQLAHTVSLLEKQAGA